MADNDRKEPSIEERAMALGWHVYQSEELAAAYAKLADRAGKDGEEWAKFFRLAEGELRSLSERVGAQMPDTEARWRRRPPW